MEIKHVLIVVSLYLLLADQSDASICCFPPTYQGFQEIIKATFKDGRMSVLTGTIQYWHDNVSRRSAFIEKLEVDGVPTEIRIVKDYNVTNTEYLVTGTKCTKKPLQGDYPYGCVSDDARNEQRRYLGKYGSANSMNIRTFDLNMYPNDISRITIDTTSCYLISDITVLPLATNPYMQYVLFSNFTEGISDYSVFDVPKLCQNVLVGK